MISVIIPTLNAAAYLPRALEPLVAGVVDGLVKEVIIADGGSSDDTLAIAEAAGCTVVSSPVGRATQLRAGAGIAKGRWLLFLHADTALAPGWIEEASRFVKARSAHLQAAAFTLAFDDDSAGARTVVFWARLRARWLKLPYGDQGFLISRFLYDAIGGFTDMPLMEDVDIVRRVGRKNLYILQTHAVTSADKYRRDGYSKRAWRNLSLLTRYLMGADPRDLAKAYD
jgi:rSAM/selenodomain-associated transferase 2